MPRIPQLSLLVLAALSLAALSCADDAPPARSADEAARTLDVSEGGAADEAGFPILEVGEAGRFTVDVAALPAGVPAEVENLEGVVHVFRMRLAEATSVAFVARAIEGELDPYVVLKDTSGATLATGRDQAILPMAAEWDAVVTFEAEADRDYVFVAADTDLEHAGTMAVDVVLFGEAVEADLGITGPGARVFAQELRDVEPVLVDHLADGAILEGVDGYVSVGDLNGVPLSERADVNRLVANVVELRGLLYAEFSAEQPEVVGRAAAELYWAIRAP